MNYRNFLSMLKFISSSAIGTTNGTINWAIEMFENYIYPTRCQLAVLFHVWKPVDQDLSCIGAPKTGYRTPDMVDIQSAMGRGELTALHVLTVLPLVQLWLCCQEMTVLAHVQLPAPSAPFQQSSFPARQAQAYTIAGGPTFPSAGVGI